MLATLIRAKSTQAHHKSPVSLNGPNGNRVPGITGTYSFWLDENIFYYVPKHKFLGGYFMPYVVLSDASGELVANIIGTNLSGAGGGSGFADMYVQPINIGWHFGKRVDFNAGYAFVAPTGRFTQGASNNVGEGLTRSDGWSLHRRRMNACFGSAAQYSWPLCATRRVHRLASQ